MNKLLTIIVAVYNTVQYLPDCLDSIINQTCKDFKLLIIDDCSNDGSDVICDEYRERYSSYDIEVIHNEVNMGVSGSWEKGVCISDTEWIYIVDSDDLLHPDVVQNIIFAIKEFPRAFDILQIASVSLFNNEIDRYKWTAVGENYSLEIKYGAYTLKELRDMNDGFSVSKQVVRREAFFRVDYSSYKEKWPRRFFNDGLFSFLLYMNANNVARLENVMYIHRDRDDSTGRVLDRYDHIRDWLETDIELSRILKNNGEAELYCDSIRNVLVQIMRLVYFIDKNSSCLSADRCRYLTEFKEKYSEFRKELYSVGYKKTAYFTRVSLRIFNLNSKLWVNSIGYIWFEILKKKKWTKKIREKVAVSTD